jgi:hypothetical protein
MDSNTEDELTPLSPTEKGQGIFCIYGKRHGMLPMSDEQQWVTTIRLNQSMNLIGYFICPVSRKID